MYTYISIFMFDLFLSNSFLRYLQQIFKCRLITWPMLRMSNYSNRCQANFKLKMSTSFVGPYIYPLSKKYFSLLLAFFVLKAIKLNVQKSFA